MCRTGLGRLQGCRHARLGHPAACGPLLPGAHAPGALLLVVRCVPPAARRLQRSPALALPLPAAQQQARRLADLRTEAAELRGQLRQRDEQVSELQGRLVAASARAAELQDWADRLAAGGAGAEGWQKERAQLLVRRARDPCPASAACHGARPAA